MNIWEAVGALGILLTATQLLPQIIKTLKSKRTRDLSLGLGLVVMLNAITWVIYGYHVQDFAVVIANIINFICATLLLILKLKSFKQVDSCQDELNQKLS